MSQEQWYQTVGRHEEMLEDELCHLEKEYEYYIWQAETAFKQAKEVKEMIDKLKGELGCL